MKHMRKNLIFGFIFILVLLTLSGCRGRDKVDIPGTTGGGVGVTRDYQLPDNEYTQSDRSEGSSILQTSAGGVGQSDIGVTPME